MTDMGPVNLVDIDDKAHEEHKEYGQRDNGPNLYIMYLLEIILKHDYLF